MEWPKTLRTKDVLSASDAVRMGGPGRVCASVYGILAAPTSSLAVRRGATPRLEHVRFIGNVNAPRALSATSAHSNGGLPRRERLPGGGQSPKGRVLGRSDPACDRELPDQRDPVRPPVHLRARPDQDG